jgi:hypothetical protein
MLTTIPTKREKKVHKLQSNLKNFKIFLNLKISKQSHIMASEASKKFKCSKKSLKRAIKVI